MGWRGRGVVLTRGKHDSRGGGAAKLGEDEGGARGKYWGVWGWRGSGRRCEEGRGKITSWGKKEDKGGEGRLGQRQLAGRGRPSILCYYLKKKTVQ